MVSGRKTSCGRRSPNIRHLRGTLTMEPLMLPINTMLPFAFRSIWDWSASLPQDPSRIHLIQTARWGGWGKTHQVPRNRRRKEIRPINIDPPQLPHPVDRVRRRLKVLCKPRRRHKIINPAMGCDNLRYTRLHRRLIRNIRIVRRNLRQPVHRISTTPPPSTKTA